MGEFDPARFRGMTESRMSRRGLLRGALAGAGGLAMAATLAGCSIPGAKANAAAQKVDWTAFWKQQKPTKQLNFANWPLYIDQDKGKYPSLQMFTKATGIKVDYQQVIQNNAPFYATVAPQLRAHQDIGYDIVVMTNGWELTEMIDNGFVMQLDHSRLPNFAKYAADSVKNPPYDPGNTHSLTWQTGFTGLAYNKKLAPKKVTSFQDLLDPAFKGRVSMMNDNTELGHAGLLAIGVEPTTSTAADWRRAAEWLKKVQPNVAGYYDQSYIDKIQNGDTWLTQAWSGDVFQAQANGATDLEFVTPVEGQMVWHDNMLIPMQAQNPLSALRWMDFYYTPEIAGTVEDWVNYVCPVPAAKDYILHELDDPDVANSPLVFPDAAIDKVTHNFRVFKGYDEYEEWNSIFNPVIQA
ncbi:MAG TPA: spermidine/putrescine ABC transporter substrate-binding protein [Microbacterium sp.]|uniref:ABC transporter substrate-binding protein n=1 Tax=Microbacterium sp. TaxID=51671 RepID=UPI002B49185A|nr:spermidine/putrescine ABC transporter substrate-binding protein [Microbacterium sp.]HKT55357.1 spermidine/putrescine ABC transporter substrate-binding protein [Microbacterium sp.]